MDLKQLFSPLLRITNQLPLLGDCFNLMDWRARSSPLHILTVPRHFTTSVMQLVHPNCQTGVYYRCFCPNSAWFCPWWEKNWACKIHESLLFALRRIKWIQLIIHLGRPNPKWYLEKLITWYWCIHRWVIIAFYVTWLVWDDCLF